MEGLLLLAHLTFFFTTSDLNVIGDTCIHQVTVPSSGDSVTVIWRAVPLFATGGYMRAQVDSLRLGRGVHAQVVLEAGRDSTTLWIASFYTARMGLKDGLPCYVRNPCPRSIVKLPTR